MTVRNRRLHEKLGMDRVRGCNAEKLLSFCDLTKQRLINELADEVHERHSWHDAASPDYRPKFHVFTEKACATPVPALGAMAGVSLRLSLAPWLLALQLLQFKVDRAQTPLTGDVLPPPHDALSG